MRECGCQIVCTCRSFTSTEVAARSVRRLSRVMDRGNDLKARAGLRPYTVTIVRARSVGMRSRGDGPTEVIGEWRIVPTPRVGDLTGITESLAPDQLREQGTILLAEISLAYTEDMLLGRGESGAPIPSNEVVFYEVRDLLAPTGARRRFVPQSAPYHDGAPATWSIVLLRAPWDRSREGTLR